MTKPIPLAAGVTYHIDNRGTNGEDLFRQERNYNYFLTLYTRYVSPYVDTFAYCLLKNHFHLLIRVKDIPSTPRPIEPSQAFSNLFNAYTKAFNKTYLRTGSLFEHPFHRIPVTNDSYFVNLIQYIHLNPQKHGFVRDFREHPHSSYPQLSSSVATRLHRTDVIERFQGRESFEKYHSECHKERLILDLIGDDFA